MKSCKNILQAEAKMPLPTTDTGTSYFVPYFFCFKSGW